MRTFDQIKRDLDARNARLDATLEALRQPLPWFDGSLNSGALLKPTCDEAGNWRYVTAAEIDGPRVPAITADERARAAVEGIEAKPITQEKAA